MLGSCIASSFPTKKSILDFCASLHHRAELDSCSRYSGEALRILLCTNDSRPNNNQYSFQLSGWMNSLWMNLLESKETVGGALIRLFYTRIFFGSGSSRLCHVAFLPLCSSYWKHHVSSITMFLIKLERVSVLACLPLRTFPRSNMCATGLPFVQIGHNRTYDTFSSLPANLTMSLTDAQSRGISNTFCTSFARYETYF